MTLALWIEKVCAHNDVDRGASRGSHYVVAAIVVLGMVALVATLSLDQDVVSTTPAQTLLKDIKQQASAAGRPRLNAGDGPGFSRFVSHEASLDTIVCIRDGRSGGVNERDTIATPDAADTSGTELQFAGGTGDDIRGGVDDICCDYVVGGDSSNYESIRDHMEGFLDEFVRLLCDLKNECCGPGSCNLDGWSEAFAASLVASRIELISQDSMLFDEHGAKACLARVATLGCSWDFEVVPIECRMMVRGKALDNHPCLSDENCAGERSICVKESIYSSFGLCAAPIRAGAYCDYDNECLEGTCEPISRVCVTARPKYGTICSFPVPF
jgi:hypothetical protein